MFAGGEWFGGGDEEEAVPGMLLSCFLRCGLLDACEARRLRFS